MTDDNFPPCPVDVAGVCRMGCFSPCERQWVPRLSSEGPVMTDDKLRDALDGLFAYDTGAVDSGIHDEALKARAKAAIHALRIRNIGPNQLFSVDYTRFVRDMWLSDEAIEQGYGLEDFMSFLQWLDDEMDLA